MHLTVNQATYVYGGSNPSRPTQNASGIFVLDGKHANCLPAGRRAWRAKDSKGEASSRAPARRGIRPGPHKKLLPWELVPT